MAFRAFVIDLDGTLLNERRGISAFSLEVLGKCQSAGKAIVLASARPPRFVMSLLPAGLRNVVWKVCYNGALTLTPQDTIFSHRPLRIELVRAVSDFLRRYQPDATIVWETADRWSGNRPLNDIDRKILGLASGSASPPLADPFSEDFAAPSKILIVEQGQKELFCHKFGSEANIVMADGGHLTQIMSTDASKESAVSEILLSCGIGAEEVAVFGDDLNDLGLFKAFRHSIAVENAVYEIKSLAWRMTLPNSQDGVAVAIQNILIEEGI